MLKEQKAPMKLVSLEKQPSLFSKYSTLSDFDLRNNVTPGSWSCMKVPLKVWIPSQTQLLSRSTLSSSNLLFHTENMSKTIPFQLKYINPVENPQWMLQIDYNMIEKIKRLAKGSG